MEILRWIERGFAAVALLSAPAFIVYGAVGTHTTRTCINVACTTTTTSDWSAHAGAVVAALVVTLVLGTVVASLILAHAATINRGLLILMWVLVPLLLASVVGFAFTWIGSDAFFWGASLLFAAMAGSIVQAVDAYRSRRTEPVHRAAM